MSNPKGDALKADQGPGPGQGGPAMAPKVVMEDDLSSVQTGSSNSNRVHTLSAMIRDLMVDKRKFDRFIHQLQRSNQMNLSSNGFVNGSGAAAPTNTTTATYKPDDKRSASALYLFNSSHDSVESGATMDYSNSRQGTSSLAKVPPSHQGGGSSFHDGDVATADTDDSSTMNTHQDDDGDSLFDQQDDQDDYSKINLDANNCNIIDAEENAAVESDYSSFLYETVIDQGSARHSEPSGMAVRQLMDLPLPGYQLPDDRWIDVDIYIMVNWIFHVGIPADRDLGGVTSQERLVQVPVNTASLGKDCKPIASSNITNAAATTPIGPNGTEEDAEPSAQVLQLYPLLCIPYSLCMAYPPVLTVDRDSY